MSEPDPTRRDFVILLCQVAWADDVVRDEERAVIHDLVVRFVPELDPLDVEEWLDHGPPEEGVPAMPPELGRRFYEQAFRVMASDGELHEKEFETLERIMTSLFGGFPDGATLQDIIAKSRDLWS